MFWYSQNRNRIDLFLSPGWELCKSRMGNSYFFICQLESKDYTALMGCECSLFLWITKTIQTHLNYMNNTHAAINKAAFMTLKHMLILYCWSYIFTTMRSVFCKSMTHFIGQCNKTLYMLEVFPLKVSSCFIAYKPTSVGGLLSFDTKKSRSIESLVFFFRNAYFFSYTHTICCFFLPLLPSDRTVPLSWSPCPIAA